MDKETYSIHDPLHPTAAAASRLTLHTHMWVSLNHIYRGLMSHIPGSFIRLCLCLSIHHSSLDGYCSTVQGLLDWFEVDLGFTELLFIQIDLCLCLSIDHRHSGNTSPSDLVLYIAVSFVGLCV